MVLTEAFASGTPVVASEIAGYSDVVEHGVDGILIPPGDPQRLAEELLRLHVEPRRRAAMGAAARESAERFAWPRIAARVERVYERAIAVPRPADRMTRIAQRYGFAPADGLPRVPAARIPSPEPIPVDTTSRRRRIARRIGLGAGTAVGFGLTFLAARRIGFDSVVESAVRSDFAWVLIATAFMCLSMFFRAGAWFLTARSALPAAVLRRRDFTSATMIGVLMSATLPARLGEPARAMIIARRIGRFRETFPILLGTLVSQTVLQHRRADPARRRHRQLDGPLPPQLRASLPRQPRSGDPADRGRRRAGGRPPRRQRPRRPPRRDGARRARQGAAGLAVFRDPRRAPLAASLQLLAWAIQVAACYALAVAMGLDGEIGIGGAAAVLFAVNVTAVVPATPSNIGVFQLAVISVLTTGYGVGAADALAYGVILQAVEIATAVGLGAAGPRPRGHELVGRPPPRAQRRPGPPPAGRAGRAHPRLGTRPVAILGVRPSRAAEGPGPRKPPQPVRPAPAEHGATAGTDGGDLPNEPT